MNIEGTEYYRYSLVSDSILISLDEDMKLKIKTYIVAIDSHNILDFNSAMQY